MHQQSSTAPRPRAPRRPSVPRVCETCGKGFRVAQNVADRGGGRYCSLHCRDAQRPRATVTCIRCKQPFVVKAYRASTARYCSITGSCPSLRPILTSDGSAMVPLHDRNGSLVGYAIVDAADVGLVGWRSWHLDADGYARRGERARGGGQSRPIPMHRDVLGLRPGDDLEGDHIDHNKLNNRRGNLRAIPRAAQQHNHPAHRGGTSRHRGVSLERRTGKWVAGLSVEGKHITVGRYATEDEAAAAVRAARLRLMPYAVD